MAVFRGDIRSSVLAMDTGLQVILPYDRPAEQQQIPCKTLYLLHGLGDNCAAWCRYTAIERYARDHGVAVVMPEAQRSFYTDMCYGLPYFTYVACELPELCAAMFHISRDPRDTYVAGLSMGGYGALKCAFTYPDRYAGCASFSGVVDIVQSMEAHGQKLTQEFSAVLGPELQIEDNSNLFSLARQLTLMPMDQRPALFLTCGQQDFLYEDNLRFKQCLESLSLDFTFREWPGEHSWDFWDCSVQQMLELFLPIS